MQITSTNEEKVLFTIEPKTAAGNPAAVENLTAVVTWGDATVTLNGLSGEIVSGSPGLNTITFTADADLGEGVTPLTLDVEYFVTAAQANDLGFTAQVVAK